MGSAITEKQLLKDDAGYLGCSFFINRPNSKKTNKKNTLGEINVSCVSPFPPSDIKFIVDEVGTKIKNKLVDG